MPKAYTLGFSMPLGFVYGDSPPARDAPLPSGPLYGLSFYVLNLAGVLPALGATEPPWRAEPTKIARQLIMHAVYGTATALVFEWGRKLLTDE